MIGSLLQVTNFFKETINVCFLCLTVDHLSKYLATRLALDLGNELPHQSLNFCIYVAPNAGQYVTLNGSQTLRQVNERFWKVNKPLEMFYSWKKTQYLVHALFVNTIALCILFILLFAFSKVVWDWNSLGLKQASLCTADK